jgi:tRNA nucleotidyltransferase (CCA-adding enzyme)
LNAAKLNSPIILIDPTFKQRNALAALSNETFQKFQKACKEFLSNPSIHAFEIKEIDIEKIKENAKKNKLEFVKLIIETDKQQGDIAGSKLLKFFNHLGDEIARYFDIKHNGFSYSGKKSAIGYFAVKSKKEILIEGPFAKDTQSVSAFKKRHKKTFAKKQRIYAKDKIDFSISKFISDWKAKNNQKVSEMSISKINLSV